MAVVAGLGLIGGLAAACFTKAYGVIFLGEPRSDHARAGHDPAPAMQRVMLTLAALCGLVGLGGFAIVPQLAPAVTRLSHLPPTAVVPVLGGTVLWLLVGVSVVGVVVGLLAAVALLERARRLARQEVGASPTWDCGYAAPTPRMQYTASSFAEPIVGLFHAVLRTRRRGAAPEGLFPAAAACHTETPDVAEVVVWRPAFTALADAFGRLHGLQHGRVQAYVLYIAVALLVLLVWGLW
jgi:hydrogenase-4 component B